MQFQFRPISQWPWPRTRNPKRAPFRVAHSKNLIDLDRELRHLAARNIVIQADVRENELRLDGMLYANARPHSPGIILSFDSKHGPLSYPCDTFSEWQDNLRAITLGLAALRAVDRYGVTRQAEQYKGWQALPNPESATSRDDAISTIRKHGGPFKPNERDDCERAIRAAEVATHPDRGGNSDDFKAVQRARSVLLNGSAK
jgi:hypothetical protein